MIPTYSVIIGGHESSGYLLGPLSLTRGRQGEGTVQPSTLAFTLDNTDGRFTPGGAGAWSADVVRGAVVTASANGVPRFTGRVDGVSLAWPHGVDSLATATFACVDVAADWTNRPIESLWREWTKACKPYLWWPLTDDSTPALEVAASDYNNRMTARLTGTGASTDGLEWGGAIGHAADEVGALNLDNASSPTGAYLETVSAVDLKAGLVIVSAVINADTTGPLVEFESGEFITQIDWGETAGHFSIVKWRDNYAGEPTPTVGPTVADAGVTHVTFPIQASRLDGCAVRVGYGYVVDDYPTRRLIRRGSVSHLAIFPSPLAYDPPTAGSGPVSSKIEYLTEIIFGAAATVDVSGTEPSVAHLAHEGSNVAAMLSTWADGTGSRWVINPAGDVRWVSYDGGSAVSVSAEWASPDIAPIVDSQGHANVVLLTLPSGRTWTYSTGATPAVRVELAGAFADDERSRALAQWIANAPDGVRLPTVTFDLLTIPDAVAPTVAALEVGDRLTITDLPDQMVTPSSTGIVEGATETWGAGAWSVTYSLTPDVSGAIWTLDHPTRGELDAMNRLGFTISPPPAADVLFADDFARADSGTVGNGWTRYHPGWGGGIVSGALAVAADYYDNFERALTFPATWTASWTVSAVAPGAVPYDWMAFELGPDGSGRSVASVGFGAGTYSGAPKTVWIDADGTAGVYILAGLPTTGDVVTVSLDAAGTLTAAVNGAPVGSLTSSGITSPASMGLALSANVAGDLAIDDFTITTP